MSERSVVLPEPLKLVSLCSWLNKLTVGPDKMPFLSRLDGPFNVFENLMSISKICTFHEIANILVWCPLHMIQTLRQV